MNSTLEAPEQTYAEDDQSVHAAAADAFPSRYGETASTPVEIPPASAEIPSVHVEIYDQIYHLRGPNPVYIARLAAMVDHKMRAVAEQGNTVDSLRVAVLAALNIADELTSLRQSYAELAGAQQTSRSSLRSRADSLSGMLDEVLRAG